MIRKLVAVAVVAEMARMARENFMIQLGIIIIIIMMMKMKMMLSGEFFL